MKIKIHQCRPKKFMPVSFLIMLFQGMMFWPSKKKYSHFVIEYIDDHSFWRVAQATLLGVEDMPYKLFLKKYNAASTYIYDLPEMDYSSFIRWFREHEGKRYGLLQAVGLALKFMRFVGHNPFKNGEKELVCNELVLLFISCFVASVKHPRHVDNFDLRDTTSLLENHVKLGLCTKVV